MEIDQYCTRAVFFHINCYHTIDRLAQNSSETSPVLSIEDKNLYDQLKLHSHTTGYFLWLGQNKNRKPLSKNICSEVLPGEIVRKSSCIKLYVTQRFTT